MRPILRRTTLALLIALALAAAAAGCADDGEVTTAATTPGTGLDTTTSSPPAGPAAELAAARDRWAAAGIDDYSMTYQLQCFCPEVVVTVTVAGGELTDSTIDSGGYEPDPKTVEDMFDEIGDAIDEGAASVDATYDADTGRPLDYFIDVSEEVADEEHGIEVLEFATAGSPTSTNTTTRRLGAPPAIDGSSLTTTFDCGASFQATDDDQEVALAITPADPSAVAPGATGTIGDTTWTGEVRLGSDLFANACDDDLEPGEATLEVDETWPVVAGQVAVTAAEGQGCPTDAAVELTGIVAVAPDGTSVEIGDLTITNEHFGCFPG